MNAVALCQNDCGAYLAYGQVCTCYPCPSCGLRIFLGQVCDCSPCPHGCGCFVYPKLPCRCSPCEFGCGFRVYPGFACTCPGASLAQQGYLAEANLVGGPVSAPISTPLPASVPALVPAPVSAPQGPSSTSSAEAPKRGPGRPRIRPLPDPALPKRKAGRPPGSTDTGGTRAAKGSLKDMSKAQLTRHRKAKAQARKAQAQARKARLAEEDPSRRVSLDSGYVTDKARQVPEMASDPSSSQSRLQRAQKPLSSSLPSSSQPRLQPTPAPVLAQNEVPFGYFGYAPAQQPGQGSASASASSSWDSLVLPWEPSPEEYSPEDHLSSLIAPTW
jgi:hypothetical protein